MSRVLLACDAGDRRDALLQAMETERLQVTATTNASDAPGLARRAHAEALVAVDSPACDALALVQSVRGDDALHPCMVIVVDTTTRHAELMRHGADQVLPAEATPAQVLAAIHGRLLRRSQLLQAVSPDASQPSAERMVQTMARAGTLQAVVVVRLGRLEQAAAALGAHGAARLRQAVHDRLAQALEPGSELAITDDGAVIAVCKGDLRASDLAVTLLARAREPIGFDDREMRLRSHVGMVECPGIDADAATLIRRADTAAREARDQGSGAPMAWTDALGARLLGDLELGSAMRRAVEAAQFRLVFQPQLRMDGGDLLGVEALIRWNLPDGVSVPPDRFVALAEESGLIDEIGSWSLREACRQAVALEESGLALRVSVNVTPRQASHPRFVETVRQALAESGLAGSRLALELGEQLLLHDRDALLDAMQAIRSLGVELCLDNYGAGFTSLDNLRRFPVTEIKICRDFVHPLPGTSSDRATVQAMLAMAQAMGLRTTAVGVEQSSQWSWLKEQGCDAAQGWLIGKPVELAELPLTLAALRRQRGRFTTAASA